ncbi:MAG: S8 family serine peptidase [Steroidobacteraceae bacterium]|nr:S8 family serine peptidase [Steroidobacteraceae bacterium]
MSSSKRSSGRRKTRPSRRTTKKSSPTPDRKAARTKPGAAGPRKRGTQASGGGKPRATGPGPKRAGGGENGRRGDVSDRFARTIAPRELDNDEKRRKWDLPPLSEPDALGDYIIELVNRGPLPDADWDATLSPEERKARIARYRAAALTDDCGHGTHVAGIIAGEAPKEREKLKVLERQFTVDANGTKLGESFITRDVSPGALRGVAPRTRLVSLRVLDSQGKGRASQVIQALEYIRECINDNPKLLRVHGVNLSVGYEFDAELFACGQSPLCTAVDRLVQEGVVVVTAAGNTGYGSVAADVGAAKVGLSNTINDPGNAALAITVGSTHRDSPHLYGVSYFSSKGPTGDGRLKPDLVAPGERITSCAAGEKRAKAANGVAIQPELAYYVDESGTSMAAPHVSGAIAAFLSIRTEFIGRPLEVKRIFLESATPLNRERYFEGHGLVDLMRAIQRV